MNENENENLHRQLCSWIKITGLNGRIRELWDSAHPSTLSRNQTMFFTNVNGEKLARFNPASATECAYKACGRDSLFFL